MVKGSNNNVSGPKRRLDLDDDTNKTESKKEEVGKRQLVDNPYKKPKSNTSTVVDASIITPETGIEKFFTKDKKDDGKKKVPPAAKRKLVSPSRGVEEQQQSDTRSGKEELYYHSDNSSEGEVPKETNPDHIHESIDYHHRGEVTHSTGQMGAYRFIRNHFLIPRNIELDPDFAHPYQHHISASAVAQLSVSRFLNHDADPIETLIPFYIRKSDAEMNLSLE